MDQVRRISSTSSRARAGMTFRCVWRDHAEEITDGARFRNGASRGVRDRSRRDRTTEQRRDRMDGCPVRHEPAGGFDTAGFGPPHAYIHERCRGGRRATRSARPRGMSKRTAQDRQHVAEHAEHTQASLRLPTGTPACPVVTRAFLSTHFFPGGCASSVAGRRGRYRTRARCAALSPSASRDQVLNRHAAAQPQGVRHRERAVYAAESAEIR